MKNIIVSLVSILCMLSSSVITAQNTNRYVSTFDETFKNETDKKSITKLRDYLYSRDEALKKLKLEQSKYAKADSAMRSFQDKYNRLNNIIADNNGTLLQVPQNLLNDIIDSKEVVTKSRTEVLRAIAYDSVSIQQLKEQVNAARELEIGIENAEKDVDRCRTQLDSLLAIELVMQEHKEKVSLYFIILIGLMLIGFFLAFLSNRPMVMTLMGDYGLQFITIFVLIIAVVLFGVLGILQSSELAAILSGISGYILGKGRGGSSLPKNGKGKGNETVEDQ